MPTSFKPPHWDVIQPFEEYHWGFLILPGVPQNYGFRQVQQRRDTAIDGWSVLDPSHMSDDSSQPRSPCLFLKQKPNMVYTPSDRLIYWVRLNS
jgi:hypothetical protein